MVSDDRLRTMALAAYERSRALFGARVAAPVALVPLVSWALGTSGRSASLMGAGLVVAVGLSMWRGGALAFAAASGLKAGLIPLALAHSAKLVGHVCTPSGCMSLCVPACATGGVVAGLLIERFARGGPDASTTRLAGVTVALLTGGLGCACVGASGLMAMVVSVGATLGAARLVPRRA